MAGRITTLGILLVKHQTAHIQNKY